MWHTHYAVFQKLFFGQPSSSIIFNLFSISIGPFRPTLRKVYNWRSHLLLRVPKMYTKIDSNKIIYLLLSMYFVCAVIRFPNPPSKPIMCDACIIIYYYYHNKENVRKKKKIHIYNKTMISVVVDGTCVLFICSRKCFFPSRHEPNIKKKKKQITFLCRTGFNT